MQRSVLSSQPASGRRGRAARLLGAVAISSVLLLTVGAGAAQAHDRGGDRGNGGKQWQKPATGKVTPTPTPKPSETQKPQTTGAYVYLKIDASKPADWPNSTQQYLVTTWSGAYWRDLTLEEVLAAVPAGLEVCGAGWGVQQDQAWGDATVFTENKAPFYPHDDIGWVQNGGPIFDAKHWDLTRMVTVPECGTTPTPTPPVSETPPPATPVTPPAPSTPPAPPVAPVPPVTEVDDSPSATPTPTPTPTVGIVASTPSPSASFYSEVLAAGPTGGATLAATGSSPMPGVLAAGILVLSGAALLLVRRRRTS